MTIEKTDLEKMNELLANGITIADIQRKYPNYDYWEIYREVNDYSFLGKKKKLQIGLIKSRSQNLHENVKILQMKRKNSLMKSI